MSVSKKLSKLNTYHNFTQFGIKKTKIYKFYNQIGLNSRIHSIFLKKKKKNKILFLANKNLIGKNLKNSIYEYQRFYQKIKLNTKNK